MNLNFFSWNNRGSGRIAKKKEIYHAILKHKPDILYLLEIRITKYTKLIHKKICPNFIDRYEYVYSLESACGILLGWNSSVVNLISLLSNGFFISIEFVCASANLNFRFTGVHAPSSNKQNALNTFWDDLHASNPNSVKFWII